MIRTSTPGIYKRGNRYVVVFRDGEGRQRKESARTLDLARRLKARRTSQVADGEFSPASSLKFQDYATEWADNYRGRRREIRQRTRGEYRRDLQAYAFRFFSKSRKLTSITARDADLFVAWLLDDKNHPRPITNRTAERVIVPVRSCLRDAARHGLIRVNPFADVVVPRPDKIEDEENTKDENRPKALSAEQIARFLACVEPRWRLFFVTLASTGARWSEAIAWRRRDLDPEKGCLKVRRTLYNGMVQAPKTKQSRRDISLAPALVEKLSVRVAGLAPNDLIFSARNGEPLRAENVRRRQLRPAADEAGLGTIGFHTFRHSAASLLFERGANIKEVQEFLGHHSPAFTLETYVHLLGDGGGPALDLDTGESVQDQEEKGIG